MLLIVLCQLVANAWADDKNDRTENGRAGPFLYVNYNAWAKPQNSREWRSPRLGVALCKSQEDVFWLERGDIMTDDWAFEKVTGGYVIRYKFGRASARFMEWVLRYDKEGKSSEITLAERVADDCIWEIDRAIEVDRRKGFQCGLRAKNGKLAGHYLGAEILAGPELVTQKASEGSKVTRQFSGWRLILTKEKQGDLRFEKVD